MPICCIYKKPYEHAEPWQCPTCEMLFAVTCEPTKTSESTLHEMQLAHAIASVPSCVSVIAWHSLVIDALAEMHAEVSVGPWW